MVVGLTFIEYMLSRHSALDATAVEEFQLSVDWLIWRSVLNAGPGGVWGRRQRDDPHPPLLVCRYLRLSSQEAGRPTRATWPLSPSGPPVAGSVP